jgi:hypothetical protein
MKIERRKESRFLRCDLTETELLAAGKEQAQKTIQLAQIEADKKRVVDDFKAKESEVKAALSNLASKVASGYEFRDVTCTVHYDDPSEGKKSVHRDDSGALVAIEDMSPSEMQREFDV